MQESQKQLVQLFEIHSFMFCDIAMKEYLIW